MREDRFPTIQAWKDCMSITTAAMKVARKDRENAEALMELNEKLLRKMGA